MQSMKEATASAKAGMEKAKASMQEKVEMMKTRDPGEKEMATERRKEETRDQNATARQAGFAAGGLDRGEVNPGYSAIGSQDYQTRNWDNATRRNVGENDPYYGTNE
ncbi:hypothetical protein HRI_000140700 [Hibiscus trionum]|uniref:Uncharacterized protein n=1 Tax=Hibiscus trionum TaxID=183268 RepID=A0A9W7LHX3_HIBTR|nr:hypothetical protein HRI_000140700 [Hibiscus trionum]